MVYSFGVTIENAYELSRKVIFESLKNSMKEMKLSALSVGYVEKNTILLFLKFQCMISIEFIRNIIAFQGSDNVHVTAFRNLKEQELFSLRLTAEDLGALFIGLQYSEISFLYELNQWIQNRNDFLPTDPFVRRHPEKYSFLKAYFIAKKPNICSLY